MKHNMFIKLRGKIIFLEKTQAHGLLDLNVLLKAKHYGISVFHFIEVKHFSISTEVKATKSVIPGNQET